MRLNSSRVVLCAAAGLSAFDAAAIDVGVTAGILPWLAWVLAGAGLVAAGWTLRGRRERRGLIGLLDALRHSSEGFPDVAVGRDPLRAAGATMRFLSESLAQERASAREQAAVRARVESELRASEERYALALLGADEGWWEWDLKTGRVSFSERWRCMLGLLPEDVGEDIDEWRRRIHSADQERVRTDLAAHLEGRAPRFENEHRVRHRDGSYRWVLARASAVRNASGKPQRLIGLVTDITARKQIQQAVIDVADGLVAVRGEACLQALVRSFAKVLGVKEAFVCECVDTPATQVRMLARWHGDQYGRCVTFDLEGTPCAEVIDTGRLVYEPREAGTRWPVERQYERNSYLGVPCIDSRGKVLGHIVCADPRDMPEVLPHEALLKIFAVRAAIELEWRALERARDDAGEGAGKGAAPAASAIPLQSGAGAVLN